MSPPSKHVRLQIRVTDWEKLVVCANLAGLPVNQQANLMLSLGLQHALRKWAELLGETPEDVWRKRAPHPAAEDED